MNLIIKKIGRFVEENLENEPLKVRRLLKAAYKVSGWQMKYLPERHFSPSEKDLAVICNKAIQQPLRDPQNSAIVNVFLPCGILYAMDIMPYFTEGLAGYLNGAGCDRAFIEYAEKSGIPKSYCSYHKILLGAALSGFLPKPLCVLNTSLACDANNVTFRTLAQHYGVPQYVIDVPSEHNQETTYYVAQQLRQMTVFLEDITGKKLDDERLIQTIKRENHSLRLYKSFLRELAAKELPNNFTSEMYRIFVTHILLGTKGAQSYFARLLKEAEKAPPAQGKLRILWVHSLPYWQRSLSSLFKLSDRYQLLCCDLNFDCLLEIDEENIYEGLAHKLLSNALGGKINRRADKLLEMSRQLRADGVIYFCHWGCKNTLGGAQFVKDRLQEAAVPVLILDGDGCDRNNVNDGQMLTRLQAFLEMLEGKR
ncbi:MAG: 2-hydroxyacyl-CoA dehydratase subunit D [Bacillota bacterium]|jgi:benzoyl-CoA reductase/2-hydroxyglutaryl-CoA dehydratase subunit BcrC/BadD/HgdB